MSKVPTHLKKLTLDFSDTLCLISNAFYKYVVVKFSKKISIKAIPFFKYYQTSCLEALYKIASKGWFVETLQILLLKTTLLFYILLRAFL